MIRGLILYYLNIKPTHGYEIQLFIKVSGMDQWAKVQSGSIYYALNKLEKEKCIQVLREERTGSRVRKIYEITDLGTGGIRNQGYGLQGRWKCYCRRNRCSQFP